MKALRHAFLPVLMALLALTGCKNDDPLQAAEEDTFNEYTVNWIKAFGLIDSKQDWNMATRITADIDPSTFGSGYDVYVYNADPREGGVLIAKVSSPMKLGLDVAEDAESVYVRAYTPDLCAYMSAEYPIVGGTVDIRVKSRGDMTLSRADSNLTEPDGYQWILACEDLGATDDYDFNDIVIGVNYVASSTTTGKLRITALAAGGTYKAYVCFAGSPLFEIHNKLNGEGDEVPTGNHTMYNTTSWNSPAATAAYTLTLEDAESFSIAENLDYFQILVMKDSSTDEGTYINAPEVGTAPQIICVKGDWEWPKERVNIQTAYPGFSEWSKDAKTSDWNLNRVESNILKRITGTVNISSETLGHEYVDLGLPSGTLWATCNIGARYPEDYGNYYAYGETATKESYSTSNNLTWGVNYTTLQTNGIIDSDLNLTPEYDAAYVNWGGAWRMPTATEMQELIDYCTWTWVKKQGGVSGQKVTSNINGNTIFLPAAGWRTESELKNDNYGYYWGSTAYEDKYGACRFNFTNSAPCVDFQYNRHIGRSVRPVTH